MKYYNNNLIKLIQYAIFLFAAGLFAAGNASAATVSFSCLTINSPGDCAIGEQQFSMDVTETNTGQVEFKFFNIGANTSSIEGIYFDAGGGSLTGIAGITGSSDGVVFEAGSSPPELPGANNVFQTTPGLLLSSVPSPYWNGINPGEWLSVVMIMSGPYSELINELATGQLRVGLHAIGFTSGGSESFINNPVPIPPAIVLFGSAILFLFGRSRRKLNIEKS